MAIGGFQGYWDEDGNWKDGPNPDREEEVRPAIPVIQSWELEELERRAAAEERWEEEQEEDGPSLEEIASYVALGIFAVGAIALVVGAAGDKNNDNTSPKDTPKGQEETPSPAPVNNGNGIPAEPAPTPKVPVPAPAPQPTPGPDKDAPKPETPNPPGRGVGVVGLRNSFS
jgi:hypothetical protein